MNHEIDKMIDAWLDGTIDETSQAELNDWIKASQENADWFARRSHMHSHLFEWTKSKKDADPETVVKFKTPTKWTNRDAFLRIAAVVLILATIAILVTSPTLGEPVANLVSNPGGELLYRGKRISRGDNTIRTGNYELKKGISSIKFPNGVEMVIEAPAQFQIESSMKVILEKGKVAASVPPEGIGFAIETPAAQVIDYGTEFAVEVYDDQSSEVHVFKGEVEVQPRANQQGSDPVRLLSNAATRVEYASDVPLRIPVDNNRFLRTLDEPVMAYSQLIKSLNPSLYYRMRIPRDGVTIDDVIGNADGRLIERGARRPPFCPGKLGGAGRFAGPKDGAFVYVPDYPKATSGLSGLCWVYAESHPRNAAIAKNGQRPRQGQFRWRLSKDTGRIQLRLSLADGSHVEVTDPEPLGIKEWCLVGFVADGEMLRLYRNGVEVSSVPCGQVKTGDTPDLFIGARWKSSKPTAFDFWHGRIDEFSLFNHALTSADINALYRTAINTNP